MPMTKVMTGNLRNRLELLFAQNNLACACDVMEGLTGWTVLVQAIVPEEFQGAIHSYLNLLGFPVSEVHMAWFPNRRTVIQLRRSQA